MSISYVHSQLINNAMKDSTNPYAIQYQDFYKRKYLPMRRKIRKLDFESDTTAFQTCADILNTYWNDILTFETTVGLTSNSKLHTSFTEEFSCYFLSKIPEISNFDIFKEGVFAGLKMNADQSVSVITKDVDFCVGKVIKAKFGKQKLELKIPIISVEMKTYTEKTMMGEIVNTARKLKGASPRSKVILLTWIKSFTAETALEVACDSYLDEIVVMSDKKRRPGVSEVEFTEKGLKDYWDVMSEAIKETMLNYSLPAMGRILTYAKLLGK